MSMASFGQLSLPEFLDQNRDDQNLWLFLHIPKTAGSSLSTELSRELAPYRNIHIDYTKKDVGRPTQIQDAVDRFLSDATTTRFRSASGHITMQHAAQIRSAIPRTKAFTFLYQRTPLHPPYKEFIAKFPRIEDYVTAPQSQDKMYRFLVGDRKTPLQEGLDRIGREFTFVGTVEKYPMSFNIIFRLFGRDVMPEQHKRPTPKTEDNQVEETTELRELILDVNKLDTGLYDHFSGLLKAREQEWTDLQATSKAA
jgi:hypothetical protein